ncbi:unnamed protein product [Heligmosomoides polygyrus]|uniref:Uncharacterized protein n=1 Tax=Heligmosomoides polygyrus TaxID=6339 RepID=A0A3P7XUX3_HELPZ|nr:unnamed protein product [Heligmosomoides polygyrus]
MQKYREQRSKMRRAEAARSRYQRMSEAERKIYNQRRRLRALGLDPDTPKGQFMDNEAIREHIKMANAKKAEAARLRYHRMSAEEKREYNQRRTESFRKRRVEEEILLSTPAGRISAEALQKAQQIMIRNARKAEAARARYQKMSPEQRKVYTLSPSLSINDNMCLSSYILVLQVSQSTDDIFEQMERDVIKRTKQVIVSSLSPSQLIDEKALHEMLITGLDANGQPVELRTVDGTLITIGSTMFTGSPLTTESLQPESSQTNMRFQPQPQPESLRRASSAGLSGSGSTSGLTVAERNEISKAKRAERARIR